MARLEELQPLQGRQWPGEDKVLLQKAKRAARTAKGGASLQRLAPVLRLRLLLHPPVDMAMREEKATPPPLLLLLLLSKPAPARR